MSKRLIELKTVALDIGAEPNGDRRKVETWEAAIFERAAFLGISVEAASNPFLRFFELGEHKGLSDVQVEEALEQITEKHYYSVSKRGMAETAQKRAFRQAERFARHGWVHDPSELIAENSPGIDRVQELIELPVENILGVDCVQEPIELPVENIPGIDRVQEPIESAVENTSGVDRVQEPIVGLTVADAWNSTDFGEVFHKADASGQLSLFEWDVSEPPDPDDYESIEDFRHAWCLWSFEDCQIESIAPEAENFFRCAELIAPEAENFSGVGTVETVSLESMCFWAPCDELLLPSAIVSAAEKFFRYLGTIAPTVEKLFRYLGTIVLTAENNCLCGQALASQC
ncbi:hypothetical protein QUB42_32755, partial [Microcoleus sp. Aus8_D1]